VSIWLVIFSPQNKVLKCSPVLGGLYSLGHNFWSAGPNAANEHFLETRHPELSNKLNIIKFDWVFWEICLLEVGLAAGVNALMAKRVKPLYLIFSALCSILPLSRCIPLFPSKAKRVKVRVHESPFAATLYSHQRLQKTHHLGASECGCWNFALFSFICFLCVFIPFHYVRPLLYKGHSIGLFSIHLQSTSSSTIRLLSVLSKWVCKSSSISWVLANSSGVLVS